MSSTINLIYAYYDNKNMLDLHVKKWNALPDEIKEKLVITIVDDCSQEEPAEKSFVNLDLEKNLFRVTENIPWGQHHARNIGAHESQQSWLLLADMDILIPEPTFKRLIEGEFDPYKYHTFSRKLYGSQENIQHHINSFLITKEVFWKCGGYDPDFCGGRGGDTEFLSLVNALYGQVHHGFKDKKLMTGAKITKAPLFVFACNKDVEGAETNSLRRDGVDQKKRRADINKRRLRSGNLFASDPIRWNYERVF